MKLIDAFAQLKQLKAAVFCTKDAAALFDINMAHASKLLRRLEQANHILRIKFGLWAFPERLDPMALPQYLSAPFPSYISLQSALYYHGMIEQVPDVIYAVSLARSQRIQTPVGVISLHHVTPSFFFGYQELSEQRIQIATPEKTILDMLYLRPTKTKLFRTLPELELPKRFNVKKAKAMISRILSIRKRAYVQNEFEKFIQQHLVAK